MSASVPTLELHLHESRCLRALRHALHALALGAVLCVPVGAVLRGLGALLLVMAWAWSLRAQRRSVRFLRLDGDGSLCSRDGRGLAADGTLGTGSLAIPGLIVLAILEQSGKRRSLWLPGDTFKGDEQRRLRVRLRVAA